MNKKVILAGDCFFLKVILPETKAVSFSQEFMCSGAIYIFLIKNKKMKKKKFHGPSSAVNKRASQSLFFAFQNNFFYTLLAFVFHLEEDFYIAHNHVFTFCFFLLLKDFGTFHKHFFEVFLCPFDNIQLTLFIQRKKLIKNV